LSNSYFINDTVVLTTDRNLTNVANIVSTGTGFLKVPAGTNDNRPGSPVPGMFRYNTTLNKFEGYSDSWKLIGGSGVTSLPLSPKQVLYAIKTGTQTTTSNNFVDITDLSLNITPSLISSKIRISSTISVHHAAVENVVQDYVIELALYRGATKISGKVFYVHVGTGLSYSIISSLGSNLSFEHIDTPGTTSSTNYNMKFRCFSSGNSVIAYINSDVVYLPTPLRSTMFLEEYTY
jgi:hypothetical protein